MITELGLFTAPIPARSGFVLNIVYIACDARVSGNKLAPDVIHNYHALNLPGASYFSRNITHEQHEIFPQGMPNNPALEGFLHAQHGLHEKDSQGIMEPLATSVLESVRFQGYFACSG